MPTGWLFEKRGRESLFELAILSETAARQLVNLSSASSWKTYNIKINKVVKNVNYLNFNVNY